MIGFEEEVHAALHPVPKSGSVGHEQLDFYISFAENQIVSAQQEIERTEPRGPYNSDKAVALETMRQYARRASYQVDQQLMAVDQSIALTMASGERGFRSFNSRPANISEEQIGRRWDSYKTLFDSLAAGAVIARVREELAKSCLPYGGDSLSAFLLRDGEGLLIRYLESRKLSLDAYYQAVNATAQIYESDLIQGTATLILARSLAAAWPRIKASLLSQVAGLQGLILEKATSWEAKSSGDIRAQSDGHGGIDVHFGSMEEFRKWSRTARF